MHEYAADIAALRRTDPTLAKDLAGFHTLENVLAWMHAQGLPLGSLDVVFQDEYSHDVLIPLKDGRCLVFGIT